MSSIEAFDYNVRQSLSFFNNEYIKIGLAVFLLLYASMAAPKLPGYIAKLFDYTLFKLFIFFLIIYISKQDATLAIITAIAIMAALMALSKFNSNQEAMTDIKDDDSKCCCCKKKKDS